MRRREFIALLSSVAAEWPLAAQAQQSEVLPVIGFLSGGSPNTSKTIMVAFKRGLNEAGFIEGQNVLIDYRWTEGQYDRMPAMAAALVRRNVAAIVAISPPAALAAKAATTTVPIVFSVGTDPVASGLVESFNRPEGNATGVYILTESLEAKRLELLHEAVPRATVIGSLVNPNRSATETQLNELEKAARALGIELVMLRAGSESDIKDAFAAAVERRIGALLVASDPFVFTRRDQIVGLAARHSIPAIYFFPEFVRAGGLMSYGTSLSEAQRLAGIYTGRILKGEKPTNLPVEQSTAVELVINMKTAKTLGITFPVAILGRANEVIE
jgi:putative tryptophan/tyrosine transport system substrate-binding protein